MKVLYLGMADDIMAPLLLIPDLTTLFVISLFDSCYSPKGTWKSQKDYIKKVLMLGNDKDTHWRKYFGEQDDIDVIHYLEGPSQITKDIDDLENKVWYLTFTYMNKERELIYYYERNFLQDWPSPITNIKHIIGIGSFSWDNFVEWRYGHSNLEIDTITKMFKERTSTSFNFYVLNFNHKHYPNKTRIMAGKKRKGENISWITIKNKTSEKWIEQFYDPEFLDGSKSIEEFQ